MQESYKPLLNKGFQIFCFERRGFGKSNGQATNTLSLKNDALLIFDKIVAMENVSEKPVIIWGSIFRRNFCYNDRKSKTRKG